MVANRWVRLLALSIVCCFACGLIPGASMFVTLFADAGVFKSACGAGHIGHCKEQDDNVANCFITASSTMLLVLLPIGIIFDRRGGKYCSCMGAAVASFGVLLLIVTVLGAKLGYDSYTSYLLVWGLAVTDFGAMMNSFSLFGLVWHFSDRQTLLICLQVGTYQIASILPILFTSCMRLTGATFLHMLFALMTFCVFGIFVCHAFAPSREEYYTEARRALGIPIPKPKPITILGAGKQGCQMLGFNKLDHALFASGLGLAYGGILVYTTNLGDYSAYLLDSDDARYSMPQLFSLVNAVVGSCVLPLLTFVIDMFSYSSEAMIVLSFASMCGVSIFVDNPSFEAQSLCIGCASFFSSSVQVIASKYVIKYVAPTVVATATAVLCFFLVPFMCPSYAVFSWMGGDDVQKMPYALSVTNWFGSLMFLGFCVHLIVKGFPEFPSMLPADEAQMAEPFGCKTIDEVMYVLHMDCKKELLKQMSSTNPKDLAALLARIDFERMENHNRTGCCNESVGCEEVCTERRSSVTVALSDQKGDEPPSPERMATDVEEGFGRGEERDTLGQSAPLVAPSFNFDDKDDYKDKDVRPLEALRASRPSAPGRMMPPLLTYCDVSCGNSHSPLTCHLRGHSIAELFGCIAPCRTRQGNNTAVEIIPHDTFVNQAPVITPMADFLEQPLLGFESDRDGNNGDSVQEVYPASLPSAESVTSVERQFNHRLVAAVREKDGDKVLSLYANEPDVDLLYRAFVDLYDLFDKDALDAFNLDWEALTDEAAYEELVARRPALKMVFLKMMAYRTRRNVFG
eukprot:TRINITY_DN33431_c0_g1_i1.p1 TRINITY_DN33431_c0_g1~~TRINITY_DN33431_c0_g1_i1.p1  ORF type:complete len:798 (-),score=133.80 TRINITY_DN33431_c0_g1_i1:30-2423(-)